MKEIFMNNLYVCMGCGYEWEENDAHSCPKCGSGDFAEDKEAE